MVPCRGASNAVSYGRPRPLASAKSTRTASGLRDSSPTRLVMPPSRGARVTLSDVVAGKLADLRRSEEQLEEARKRLSRLHDAIEVGTMSARDDDARECLKNRRTEIDALNATVASLRQQLDRGPTSITPAAVTRFGALVRQRLIEGDSKTPRRIINACVKTVRVGETIKIEGETNALVHGVAALARSKGSVPIFDRSWCGREDSNFHGLSPTTTSTLRVYQFRHDRTRVCRGRQAGPAVGARP